MVAVGQEAVGVIAIGQLATGVVAIGQGALGVVAIGQLSRGVIAFGQLAAGGVAFGQLALGCFWAGGMLAVAPVGGSGLLVLGAFGDLSLPDLARLRWNRFRRHPHTGSHRIWAAVVVAVVCAAVVAITCVPLARQLPAAFDAPPPVLR